MKFTSPVISSGSGSIAGITFSRNKGGMYMRARAIPTNPNSVPQQNIRGHLATLVGAWTNTLTTPQRGAWDVYAANTPVFDALGASIHLTGQQMFIRSNTARLQVGLPLVTTAPGTFDLGTYSIPSAGTVSAAADTIQIAFDNTDEWANEDDSNMLIYTSRPQNPSVNYFKGPYQFAGMIPGDGTTPPTSPATITLAFPVVVGQKVFWKATVTRADGRYSIPFRAFGLAT